MSVPRHTRSMSEPLVYLNDRMLPASQAALPIFDAGVVLGATASELTRTFGHRLFRLDDHLERLYRSLALMRLDIGRTPAELATLSHDLVARNARLVDPGQELGLIHFVTPGAYRTYAGMAGPPAEPRPTVCMHTFPLPYEQWAAKLQTGAKLVIPATRHLPPECVDPRIKCRSRMHYYLADQEARESDPEASALLLDLDGHIAETSAANVAIVAAGMIVFPRFRNTLPGISQSTVIELAGDLRIPVGEQDLTPPAAMDADEAFLTSTPYCVMPVASINGTPIGAEVPGPITRRLWQAWSEKVGIDVVRQIVMGAEQRTARQAGA